MMRIFEFKIALVQNIVEYSQLKCSSRATAILGLLMSNVFVKLADTLGGFLPGNLNYNQDLLRLILSLLV